MKMNAKKLTIVLVALLLALTCVFAACKKDDKVVDDTPAAESLAKEELVKVAEQFKKDYEAKYLDLYTSAVATELEANKAQAILEITGATSKTEAEGIAKAYIDKLEAAKTLVDEIKALVAALDVEDIALADEAAISTMLEYAGTVEAAINEGKATGERKAALDKYDAATKDAVKAISARFVALQIAKLSADAGVNADIDKELARLNDEKTVVNMGDFATLLELEAAVEKFAAENGIDATDKAYKEIFHTEELAAANAKFEERTKDDAQIQRAIAVVKAARALQAAAEKALYTATKNVWVDGDDLIDYNVPTPYYMNIANFLAGGETAAPGKTFKVLIDDPYAFQAFDDLAELDDDDDGKVELYVNPDDVYTSVQLSNDVNIYWVVKVKDSKEVREIAKHQVQVIVDGKTMWANTTYASKQKALDKDVANPIEALAPLDTPVYRLSLQTAVEDAAKVAKEWYDLIDQAGTLDLKENLVVKSYYDVIIAITNDYNKSLAIAIDEFNQFKDLLVVPNYVNEIPASHVQYDEYYLGSKEIPLSYEIERVKESAKTLDDDYGDEVFAKSPTFKANDEYTFQGASYIPENTSDTAAGTGRLNYVVYADAHKNDDGSYTPTISYKTWAYKYKIDGTYVIVDPSTLATPDDGVPTYVLKSSELYDEEKATEAEKKYVRTPYMLLSDGLTYYAEDDKVVVDGAYAGEYEVVIGGQDATLYINNKESKVLDLANLFVEWIEKYIGEEADLPDDFDLEPYHQVKEGDAEEFGVYVLTFADYETEEVAVRQVVKLNGEEVTVPQSQNKTFTVYSDLTVAKEILKEQVALEERNANLLKALDDAVLALFKTGKLDAIKAARDAYKAALISGYLSQTVYDLKTYLKNTSLLARVIYNNGRRVNYVLDVLGEADFDNTNADGNDLYNEIIYWAEDLQAQALALYPMYRWDAALEGVELAVENAKDELIKTKAIYEDYLKILEAAKADLEHIKIGLALNARDNPFVTASGATTPSIYQNYLVTFYTDADLEAAQKRVDILEQWEWIFKNASKAWTDNREFGKSASNFFRNPAYLSEADVAQGVDLDALKTQILGFVMTEHYVDVALDRTAYNAQSDLLKTRSTPYINEIANVLAADKVETVLATMITILDDASKTVEYIDADGNAHTFDGKRTMFDIKGRERTFDEAEAARKATLDEFVKNFKIGAAESYYQLDSIYALMADIEDFVKSYGVITRDADGKPVEDEKEEVIVTLFDYVNLTILNLSKFVEVPEGEDEIVTIHKFDYEADRETKTIREDAPIDLFSETYNAAIMGRYYKSVMLTLNFANAKVGNTTCLTDKKMPIQYKETAWLDYAENTFDEEISSTETFTKVADGNAAVKAVKSCKGIRYDWAIDCMNADLADDADPIKLKALETYLKDNID